MLRELGYVEGQNLALVLRGAEGDFARFPSLIRELIATEPEVIVAETTPGALAAKRATSTIPIVIINVSDPVGSGLVDSLGHPGGNVTGVKDFETETAEKSVELVRTVVPNAVRLGVLMSDNPVHSTQFESIRTAAGRISLTALPFHVASFADVDRAFSAMVAKRSTLSSLLGARRSPAQGSRSTRLSRSPRRIAYPRSISLGMCVTRGGLMSYGTNISAAWEQAARYVDRILKGAKPADLPVQQPTNFELFINRKTAASLGIKIPHAVQLRAEFIGLASGGPQLGAISPLALQRDSCDLVTRGVPDGSLVRRSLVRAQVEEPEFLLRGKRLGRRSRRFFLGRAVGIGCVKSVSASCSVLPSIPPLRLRDNWPSVLFFGHG
jgi:putative ABC transport system substrate-binding protein